MKAPMKAAMKAAMKATKPKPNKAMKAVMAMKAMKAMKAATKPKTKATKAMTAAPEDRWITMKAMKAMTAAPVAEDRWTVPTWTPDERWKDKGTVHLGRHGMFNCLERRADGLEILVPAWRVEGILGAVILDEVFESN